MSDPVEREAGRLLPAASGTGPAADTVDVWWMDLGQFGPERQVAALSLLDSGERVRHAAFISEPARQQFLAGRALVRTCLSRYGGLSPHEWRFRANRYGRPFVDERCGPSGLYFNLSHTEGMAVCAIAGFGEIGVDVERCDRHAAIEELGETVLAPAELAQLSALTGAERQERFYRFWTLKEAYLKARGVGLSLPMNDIRFDLSGMLPSVAFAGVVDDAAARWSFRMIAPGAGHIVAVAAAVQDAALRLRVFEATLP